MRPSRIVAIGRAVLVALALSACSHTARTAWRPVPWLEMRRTDYTHSGLIMPADTGGIPHFGTSVEGGESGLWQRLGGIWTRVSDEFSAQAQVLGGGRSVLLDRRLYVDGRAAPLTLPDWCSPPYVRSDGERIVCADCSTSPCDHIRVEERDPDGRVVAAYGADVPAADFFGVAGLTARGVLVFGGASRWYNDSGGSLQAHDVRCQIAEIAADGLHPLERAATCEPEWFPRAEAAHAAPAHAAAQAPAKPRD